MANPDYQVDATLFRADQSPPTRPRPSLNTKTLWLIARLGIVTFIYWMLAKSIDTSELVRFVRPSVIYATPFSALVVLLQVVFCVWRWRFLASSLTPALPSFRLTFWTYEEGLFYNQLLPSTIGGDVVRVLRWQAAGVRGLPAASSVFLDRLSGLNGAALVLLFGVPVLIGRGASSALSLLALFLSLTVLLGTVGGFAVARWPKLTSPLARFPRVWHIAETLRKNLEWNAMFVYSLSLSLIGHVLSGLAAYCLALALGVDLPAFTLVFVTSLVVLVSTVPVTIAGWGLRELSYVSFLSPFGVDRTEAFALGVLFGLVMTLTALPGGLALLFGLSKPGKTTWLGRASLR